MIWKTYRDACITCENLCGIFLNRKWHRFMNPKNIGFESPSRTSRTVSGTAGIKEKKKVLPGHSTLPAVRGTAGKFRLGQKAGNTSQPAPRQARAARGTPLHEQQLCEPFFRQHFTARVPWKEVKMSGWRSKNTRLLPWISIQGSFDEACVSKDSQTGIQISAVHMQFTRPQSFT